MDWQREINAAVGRRVAHIGYLPRILGLVWHASKGYTLAWAILLVLSGLVPAAAVYLTRLLVDSLVDAIRVGSLEDAAPLLVYGGLMAGLMVLGELFSGAIDWVRTAQAELVQDHISELVHEKSTAVDLAFYESPEYHDRLDRARSDANGRSIALLEGGGSLIQNGITLVAMGSLLVPYGIWLPFVLLASTLPAFAVVVRFSRRLHRWSRRTTPDRRWVRYYDWVLTYSGMAAEIRLFNLGRHFRTAHQALRGRLRLERLALAKGQGVARVGAGSLALVVTGAATAWMVWRAVQGLATLGDLALFYQAFNRGQGLMRVLLNNVGQIYSNSLFIRDLFEFLELQPQVAEPARPARTPDILTQGISFNGVTFHYPGSDRPALQGFDLTVPAGQTVALVGANGAGKSTVVKLLCRFYDPSAGTIELDGTNIRDMPTEELRRRITVLFQFLVPYHATAAQNIALGDIHGMPGAAEVERAARDAGAHEVIERLPMGYETLLGKWFADGTELSAGEWQLIALARAFVRQAPIMVLDEPTSFMDSWAEVRWLERLRTLVHGRTAIMVTHRFTTAMRADTIHVMDGGQIVESGTHRELLASDGLYARSWTAQMQVAGEDPEATPTAGKADQRPAVRVR